MINLFSIINVNFFQECLRPDFPLDTNPAYVDHMTLSKQIKEISDIAMKKNEAYMEVTLNSTFKMEHGCAKT